MGAQFSKRSGDSSSHGAHFSNQMNSDSQVTTDLSSYEAACRIDPDLQSFDSTLRERTSRVINTLAVGVEVQSLSLDSFREVTECLLDMNQDVVKVILECQEDIWNNHDLSDLIKEYFENSLLTLDFCTSLEKCLKRARNSQLIVQVALQQFEEEQREGIDGGERKYFVKTLQELKNFKTAGDPFTEEFFSLFHSVHKQQMSMLEKLQLKKRKLDDKLKSLKTWRKVLNVIFGATFAAVLIFSLVVAAIAAPPVVTALAAAASVSLGSMGSMRKWFNSLWRKYENEVKAEKKIISSLQIGTYIAIKDFESIRVLVDRLEILMESLFQNADFALQEKEAVILAIDEIKKKLSGFMQTIDDLCEHADKFSRDINRARTVILQRIIKHPNND